MCWPEILHEAVFTRQIQKVEQELQSFINFRCSHAEDPAKVHHGFSNWELSIQGSLLQQQWDVMRVVHKLPLVTPTAAHQTVNREGCGMFLISMNVTQCSLVQCYISEDHKLTIHLYENLKANALKHQKGNRELHIWQQPVQVHKQVTMLLFLRIPVFWDVTMLCWAITLLWKLQHSHDAVLVCCTETDINKLPETMVPTYKTAHCWYNPTCTSPSISTAHLSPWPPQLNYTTGSCPVLWPSSSCSSISADGVLLHVTYWLKVFPSSLYILAV